MTFPNLIRGAVAAALSVALLPAQAQSLAGIVEIDGAIGPATSGHIEKAFDKAEQRGVSLILLRVDTPGGLDAAMRDIIKRIEAASVPVVAWVGPSGARAASAGTYILYASHIAAMAPATNLGAATPVPIGGGDKPPVPDSPRPNPPVPDPEQAKEPPTNTEPPPSGDAMQKKIINDAVAYIRSLAEQRGRNADWAEEAVREGASLSAEKALEANVIDLMAPNVAALLEAINGRKVELASGVVTLDTVGMVTETFEPDWRMRLLAIITNPTVAYILMLIGIYGLLLEGYNPGAILPGVTGAICLLLALFAFQVLPINYVGLGLILLGIVLMIAETLAPSFGVLGFGGIVAFVIGSVMLMDSDVPGYAVNLWIIAATAMTAALFMGLTLYLLMKSRRKPVVTGDAGLLGARAVANEDIAEEGWATVLGENWRIRPSAPMSEGERGIVESLDGLTLNVVPDSTAPDPSNSEESS